MRLNYKIIGSTISAVVMGGILIWCANSLAVSPDDKTFVLNISIMIFGTIVGWIVGILASPYGPKEEKQFSTIVQGVAVFFSGYALAKVDPIITALLKPESFLNPIIGFRAIAFLSFFFLSLIVTFVYRQYAR